MSDFPTSAIILAAGFGTRMRPLTNTTPKPLLEVCGKSMLDRALDNIAEHGITNVVINAHYLWKQLKEHIIERNDPLLNITISVEDEILESGGAIYNNLELLGEEPFFIINGDIVWVDGIPSAFFQLYEAWNEDTMDALLLLQPFDKAIGYEGNGDFDLEKEGEYLKVYPNKQQRDYVFTGIWLAHPRFFKDPPAKKFSSTELFKRAFNSETQNINRVAGVINKGSWLHVGTPEGLYLAERYINVMII